MKTTINRYMLLVLLGLWLCGCSNFLEVNAPRDSVTAELLFSNDEVATSTVTGIYAFMRSGNAFSGNRASIHALAGLSADELRSYSTAHEAFYVHTLIPSNGEVASVWANIYNYIYRANVVLEGLENASDVSAATKRQLRGEAYFVRAFSYFYLTGLFGGVPLHLTSDQQVNREAFKSTQEMVMAQVVKDLLLAEELLSADFVTVERVRPTRWAAKAMLARCYLYLGQWQLSVTKSSEVIGYTALFSMLADLDKVFLKNSGEAIWQLMPADGSNTPEGALFVLAATPLNVALAPGLAAAFETGDLRRSKWIGQYTNSTGTYLFSNKYKVRTTVNGAIVEYATVLRLSEMYLVRAEALAQLGQMESSVLDLEVVRKRAGLLLPLGTLSKEACLSEVERQRRLELFCEWGHRWLDLKRTGRAGTVLAALKGAAWKPRDIWYPLPEAEVERNLNIKQNEGY